MRKLEYLHYLATAVSIVALLIPYLQELFNLTAYDFVRDISRSYAVYYPYAAVLVIFALGIAVEYFRQYGQNETRASIRRQH